MELVNCKFSFTQRVRINSGFYKGFIGKIQKVEQDKNNNIIYEVQLEKENLKVKIPENNLSKTFTKLF